MTDEDRAIVAALAGVRFPLGSAAKRLARDLVAQLQAPPWPVISVKQRAAMVQMRHRFRRQIDPAVPGGPALL